jgi:hypothetical protein
MSRSPTGTAVTSKGLWGGSRAASDAIAFAGNGSPTHQLRFSLQHLHPPRWSHPIRVILARETTAAVSIAQHPVSILPHGSEPVLTALNLRRSRLEGMQVWQPSARRCIDEIFPQGIHAWWYCRFGNRATMVDSQ